MLHIIAFCGRAGLALSALGLVFIGAPDKARSETLTYNFTGNIVLDQFTGFGKVPISGSFSFDTNALPDPLFHVPVGTSVFLNAVTGLQFTVAGYTASGSDGKIQIDNDNGTDQFLAWANDWSSAPQTTTGIKPALGQFRLIDASMKMFDTALTLPTALDVTVYNELRIVFSNNSQFYALIDSEPATVSSVPLPAALPLFASILAGGGLIAWRRKRKATRSAA